MTLTGAAAGDVVLASNVTNLGAFAVSGGKNFTLTNDGALVVTGAVALTNTAPGVAGKVTLITTTGGITVDAANGSISAGSLGVTSAAAVSLIGLNISGAMTGTVAGAMTLSGTFGSITDLVQTANGTFTVKSSTDMTSFVTPRRADKVTGDLVYITTGTGRIMLPAPASPATAIDFGANNVTFGSDVALEIAQNIRTTGKITLNSGVGITTASDKKITADTVSGSAAGVVNLATNVVNLGAFTVTGGGNFTLVNDAALTVNGAVTLSNVVGSAAGNISLKATTGAIALNAAVTAGDVSLTASGVGARSLKPLN